MPGGLPKLRPIFDRFLIDFHSQLRTPEPRKSSPHYSGSTIFQKLLFEVNMQFGPQFGANLASFSFPKSTNIPPKSVPRCMIFLIDFCIDVYSILAPFWGPSWGHVGRQDAPKTPQDAAGTRPGNPGKPPRRPKRPQEAPRGLQDPFLVDF